MMSRRLCLAVVLTIAACLPAVFAQNRPASGAPEAYEIVGTPLDGRKLPSALNDARELADKLDRDRKRAANNAPSDARLLEAIDSEVAAAKNLVADLERRGDEVLRSRREELKRLQIRRDALKERYDKGLAPVEALGKDLDQLEARLRALESERDRLKNETLPAELARLSDRAKQVAAAQSELQAAEASRASAEQELREREAAGAEPAEILALTEKAFAARLEEHRRRLTVAWRQSKDYEELLKLAVQIAETRIAIVELETAAWGKVVAGERVEQERIEKARLDAAKRQQSFWEAQKGGTEYSAEYVEAQLEFLGMQAESANAKAEQSTVSRAWTPGGTAQVLMAESTELANAIANSKLEEGAFDDLPTDAREIERLIEAARRRVDEYRSLRQEYKRRLRELRERRRAISRRRAELDEWLIALMTRSGGQTQRGVSAEAARREWEDLKTSIATAATDDLNAISALITEYQTRIAATEEAIARDESSIAALEHRRIWTRTESEVSVESLERAVSDLGRLFDHADEFAVQVGRGFVRFVTDSARGIRLILGAALVLILGAGMYLAHKRLPRTYRWLEDRDARKNDVLGVVATVLRRTDVPLMLAVLFVGVPIVIGLEARVIRILAIVFLTPLLYSLGRVLLEVSFSPAHAEDERLVPVSDETAEALYRAGRLPLLVATFLAPPGLLLRECGYGEINPGFMDLYWLLFRLFMQAVLLFAVFRPRLIRVVIRGEGVVANWIKTGVLLTYPIVFAALVGLLVLDGLRYHQAAAYFRILLLKTAGVFLAAYVIYRFLLSRFVPRRDFSTIRSADEFADEAEYLAAGRQRFVDRCVRLVLRVVTFVPAYLMTVRMWPSAAGWMNAPIFGEEGGITSRDVALATVVVWATVVLLRYYREGMRFLVLPRLAMDRGLAYTVLTLSSYLVFGVGVFIALRVLNVEGDQIAMFSSALALGIGFGLQSIVKNFVSGVILLVERPLKVGDIVSTSTDSGPQGGRVEKITMRATTIMAWDGTGIVIPNEQLIGGTLTNHSLGRPRLRTNMLIGVAYGSDVGSVRDKLLEIVNKHGLVLKRPAPDVYFQGFGASSLDFELRYWTHIDTNRVQVASDVRFAIEAAFRRASIEIPFPQHDLHIRSVDPDAAATLLGERPGTTVQGDASGVETTNADESSA